MKRNIKLYNEDDSYADDYESPEEFLEHMDDLMFPNGQDED